MSKCSDAAPLGADLLVSSDCVVNEENRDLLFILICSHYDVRSHVMITSYLIYSGSPFGQVPLGFLVVVLPYGYLLHLTY